MPPPDPFEINRLFPAKSPWQFPVPRLSLASEFSMPPATFQAGPLLFIATTTVDQIRNYLDRMKTRLDFATLDELVSEVKLFLAGKGCGGTLMARKKHADALRFAGCYLGAAAHDMADADVRRIIANYCFEIGDRGVGWETHLEFTAAGGNWPETWKFPFEASTETVPAQLMPIEAA
jgi:hypothetical protein